MKIIRFRGKRTDYGGWVRGYLFDPSSFTLCFILVDESDAVVNDENYNGAWSFPKDLMNCYEVDPKTVGQFTGRIDKNGKEIYEGDIMFRQILNSEGKVIREYNATVVFIAELAGYYLIHDGTATKLGTTYEILNDWSEFGEVVGNIYENPVLL